MIQKEIGYNGKQLFYRSVGSGPLVVLLHGFGEDGTIWETQWQALAGYHILIPDLPGSGRSEMSGDMSMEGQAEAVKFIIDTENTNAAGTSEEKRFTLIGHSMGGYISLAFAEKYPDLLNGLGLFHSSAFADSEEKIATRRKGIRAIQENGALEFLKTSIPNLFSEATREQNPALVEELVQKAGNFSAEALIAYYEAMIQRPDRTHVLQQNDIPVLMVMGRYDTAVPLQDGLKQAHLPGKSYIHIMEQSGHMGMKEEPEKSNDLLLHFLQELS